VAVSVSVSGVRLAYLPLYLPLPLPHNTTQQTTVKDDGWPAAWSSNAKMPYTWVGIRFVFIFMCSVASLAADAGLHTELTRCRGRINHEQRSSLGSKKINIKFKAVSPISRLKCDLPWTRTAGSVHAVYVCGPCAPNFLVLPT